MNNEIKQPLLDRSVENPPLRKLLGSCLYLTFIEACYAALSPSQTAFLAKPINGQQMVAASELFFPLQTFAIASGIEAVCALYPVLKTRENYWQAVWFSMIASVGLSVATLIFAGFALIGKDPETVGFMNTFLWSFIPGYPGVLLLQNLYNYLLGASHFRYTKLVATMAAVSVAIEILISYFLVALLGVASVGLATTLQTYFVFGVMSIYFAKNKTYSSYFHSEEKSGTSIWRPDRIEIKKMLQLSWPLTASMMLQTITLYIISVVVSSFSEINVLAFQIASQCLVPLMRGIYAFARVSTITIGNLNAELQTPKVISTIHQKIMKLVVGVTLFYVAAISITPQLTNALQDLFLKPNSDYSSIIERSRMVMPIFSIIFLNFAVYRTYIASFAGLKKNNAPLKALSYGTIATLGFAFMARFAFSDWSVFGVIGALGLAFSFMALYLRSQWKKEMSLHIAAGEIPHL